METSLLKNIQADRLPEWDETVLKIIALIQSPFGGGGNIMTAAVLHNGEPYRVIRCEGLREYMSLISDMLEAGFEELIGGGQSRNGYDLMFQAGAAGIAPIPESPEEEY